MKFDINDCELTFDKTVKVSEGVFTLPYLTLLKVDNYCYLVNHVKKKLPSKKELLHDKGFNKDKGYTWESVDSTEYCVIKKGITNLQNHHCTGVITFSYLLGYCEACGVDLLDYLD